MALSICRVLTLPCRMGPGSSPFFDLWARGLLWGTWVSTLGGFINCLSVTAIKHHDQKQPKDKRVPEGQSPLWWGKNDMAAGTSNWLVMFSSAFRKQKGDWK